MKIALITGSCGLVGSESALFFSKKGFEIIGIENNARKFFFGKDGDTTWIKSKLKSSLVGEINYSSDWYDYESKYSIKNKIIIPANIDSNTEKIIQNLSIEACKALNISSFARADFFLDRETNSIYLNEINTIPGFTASSMFPMLWAASGLEIDQLVATLVDIVSES